MKQYLVTRMVILTVILLVSSAIAVSSARPTIARSAAAEPFAPGHDQIAQARLISSLPYQDSDDTSTATTSGNDPIFPCGSTNQGGASVWYKYTPSTTINLVAHTHGSNYDTMLAVWTGTPGNLTNVACSDDSNSPNYSAQSEVRFTGHAGTLYYLEIASYNGIPGGNLVFTLLQSDLWKLSGPQHTAPSINELTLDPQNSNIVYAATTEGVYKSTNGGTSWAAKLNGLGTFGGLEVTNLVVNPSNSQTLYISTWGDGVYKSTDGGNNWTLLQDPVNLVEPLPEGAERIRAGGPSPNPNQAPITPGAKRSDAGNLAQNMMPLAVPNESDTVLFAPGELDFTPSRYLAIHPTNANRLIVSVAGWGHYISENAGSSWNLLTMPGATSSSGRTVAFAPSNPNIAYASMGDWGSNGGIFRSTNGGQTWSLVSGNSSVTSVVTHFAIHPTNPNQVLVSTYGQGVMVTTNGGTNWNPSNSGMSDTAVYNIEFSPANSNIVFATGNVWVWKSVTGGASWTIADTSYPDFYTWGLALHPTNSNVLYVGSHLILIGSNYEGQGVYKSTNGGSTLTPQSAGMQNTYVLEVEPDPTNPNLVYVGLWGSGFYRSTNAGITWQQGNSGMTLPFIYAIEATQGVTGTILYAGTFYTDLGLYKSNNQGQSWTPLPNSLPGLARNVFDIESSDGSSNNLVVATGDGIHVSTNGGQTWTVGMLGAVPTEGIILDIERVGSRLLAGTYGDGIYYSNNGGFNWSLATGEPSTYVYGLSGEPGSTTEVYAATLGLAKSTNGGLSWQAVTHGVPTNLFFRTVDHSLDGTGDVFAGSIGQGMWVSPDSSDIWMPFSINFTPLRVRSVNASFGYPIRIFAGTDGQSAWSYTPYRQPVLHSNYSPLIVK